MNVETPRLLTVDEAAARLRQSRPTLYRKIEQGVIGAVRLGDRGPLRIPEDELEAHLRPASSARAADGAGLAGPGAARALDAGDHDHREGQR
jgi:excisionase family DNA binding protein